METVHFTQQTFRAIMECFASPGELKKLDVQLSMAGLYDATASLCITLLDGEVSYFSFSEGDTDIQAWTGAKKAAIELADFIIVSSDATEEQVIRAIHSAKIGNLINPQQSATIIIEISNETQPKTYKLTGPGIQTKRIISCNLPTSFIKERAHKNKEFPLGVDVVIVDSSANLFALPRTTQIEEVEE